MTHGTSLKRPSRPDELLDIDEETLDSALMDLLTSDWQTLDDGDSQGADPLDDRPPPAESAPPR